MAKIETAKLGMSDHLVFSSSHLNISGIVGAGGKNERNDVMLIKALLFLNKNKKDVSDAKFWGSSAISLIDLPEITGIIDAKTIQDIWEFQKHNASRLLSLDGKIHPASYQNRVIKNALSTFLNRCGERFFD